MVDHGLSKGVILCPTKKTVTANGIAAIIFQKLYTHFGLFDKVISDRGPQFTANFAKELGCILGYEISLSTAYHPQTNREMERLNQEVETYLRIFCGSHPETWMDHIPMAEFVHNHPLTPPPANPHFTSCLAMNCKPSPASLKLPTFRLWKIASETLTLCEKKHLLCTNLCSNS